MKNNFYLKHQLTARHDSRMELLFDTEGPKGIGVYWMIVEELAMFPDDTTTIKNVYKHLKMYKISKSYITKIIFDYQLFDLFEDDYISPAELNPSKPTELKPTKFREEETTESVAENHKTKRTEEKKTVLKAKENTVSTTKNNTKQCSVYDENRSKNDGTNSFFDAKKHENCKKTLEESYFPTLARAANSLIINDLRKTNTGIKENIRDIITTTTEKEKEKEPAAVVDDAEKVLGNAAKKYVDDAQNAFRNVYWIDFNQADLKKMPAFAIADKTPNSGNCKNQNLPPPNAIAGTDKCNSKNKPAFEETQHRVNCVFLNAGSSSNPALYRSKCHRLARQLPQLYRANDACHAPPSVAIDLLTCGKWSA